MDGAGRLTLSSAFFHPTNLLFPQLSMHQTNTHAVSKVDETRTVTLSSPPWNTLTLNLPPATAVMTTMMMITTQDGGSLKVGHVLSVTRLMYVYYICKLLHF